MGENSNTLEHGLSDQLLQKFQQEVKDASELLTFAIAQGRTIEDDIVFEIKKAEDFLLKDELPPAIDRTKFENSYRDLSQALKLITITSLRDTSDEYGRKVFLLARKTFSEGKIWSRKLWLITICFAVVAFLGDYLQTIVNHPFFTVDYETGRSVFGFGLVTWQVFAGGLKAIVPFTYGGLGSCAYLLRICHKRVHERIFDRNRMPEYYSRILLGVISGGAIMLFIDPTEQSAVKISAAALAFLTGYNTDFLFTTIERAAGALFPKGTAAEGQPEVAMPVTTTPLSLKKLLERYEKASPEEKKVIEGLINKFKERM